MKIGILKKATQKIIQKIHSEELTQRRKIPIQ